MPPLRVWIDYQRDPTPPDWKRVVVGVLFVVGVLVGLGVLVWNGGNLR